MKLVKILTLVFLGFSIETHAAARATDVDGAGAGSAKTTRVHKDFSYTNTEGETTNYRLRSIEARDNEAADGGVSPLHALRAAITHGNVKADDGIDGPFANNLQRLTGYTKEDGTEVPSSPFAWMVIVRLNAVGEEVGPLEALMMGGSMPTASVVAVEGEEETFELRTPGFLGLEALAPLKALYPAHIGIDYQADGKAIRDGNKGAATIMPALPDDLVADTARAAHFVEIAGTAFAELAAGGALLAEDSVDADGKRIRGTVPGVIVSAFDRVLLPIYEAATGVTVIKDPWVNTLYADSALAIQAL
jgi:hypothetical protein